MRNKQTAWAIQKYGQLVKRIDEVVEGHNLTYKLYYYKGLYMTETWFDGYLLSANILPI